MKRRKGKRFVQTSVDITMYGSAIVFVDQETGVNYVLLESTKNAGVSVMLNADGTPVVTPIED